MVTIKIKVKDPEYKKALATLIHTGLRGYDEYIDNRIVLNFTDQEDIVLSITGTGREELNKGKDIPLLDTVLEVEYKGREEE